MNNFLKLLSVVMAVFSFLACAQFQMNHILSRDVPSVDEIVALENLVKMPPGATPLSTYRRYYALEDNIASDTIVGIYLRNEEPGVSIVVRDAFPSVSDGGVQRCACSLL